jgi:PAS domain S-box-containing protein
MSKQKSPIENKTSNELDYFFDMSLDMLCIAGTDGYFRRINPAFERTLGWTTTELKAKSFLEFIHPDDIPATLAEIEKLAQGAITIHFDNRYLCQDGSYKWLSWNAQPMPEGTIYAIARDVTEEKEAAELLARSVSLLQATIESTTDGILVVNTKGEIMRFNQKFVEMWHIPDEVIALQSSTQALGFVMDQLIDPEQFLSRVRELYSQPEAESFDVLHFKDGRIFERYSQPQWIQDKIVGRVWSFRDVTQRIKTEALLREHEAQRSEALAIAQVGYWEFDVETHRFTFTDEFYTLYGTTAEQEGGYQMSAEQFAEKFVPHGASIAAQEMQKAIENRDKAYRRQLETRSLRVDGTSWDTLVRFKAIKDENNRTIRVVGANQDITDRKQAELRLAKQATDMTTVAEISTIISAILEPQEMLQSVVDLTKKGFNLYHANIYLLNPASDTLTLAAAAGDIGQKMIAENWPIPVSQERSLIARSVRTRQGVVVSDINSAQDYLPHPLLPATRSEMAVPMIVGNQILGVLDFQSDETNRFSKEDIRIGITLASQIAVALQNLRSFEQSQQTLKELDSLTRRLTHTGWEDYLAAASTSLGYLYDLRQISSFQPGDVQTISDVAGLAPIKKSLLVHGEAIGHLALTELQTLSDEATEIIDAVASRLSAHLENLRLSEQIGRVLAQTEALYKGSDRIIRANTIAEALEALVASTAIQRVDRATVLFFDKVWHNQCPQYMQPIAVWERAHQGLVEPDQTLYTLEEFPIIDLFSQNTPVIFTDIATDERVDANTRAFFLEELGMQSLVVFPLVVGGQWFGVITGQTSTTLTLTEDELRQISSLIDQAATVIQNQRLLAQAQARIEQERRVRVITDKIRRGADREAILRIAREEIGQMLNATESVAILGTQAQLFAKLTRPAKLQNGKNKTNSL